TEKSTPTPIIFAPQPADEVHEMPTGAFALVMTHSHDEDFAISEALLRHGRFGWAGVIGSASKAKRFRQRLQQRGFAEEAIARLTMPIGIDGIRSKEAAAIAVGVAAQLLQRREARDTAEARPATAVRRS
ncbi:MAG: XdhC family protein, partial [Usitatibacter sp.]